MENSTLSLAETVEAVVQQHRQRIGPLMLVLHGLQERLGHIPADAIPLVAQSLGLSRAEVHGVMHFYHDFRELPAGRHVIQLCRAEACQAVGANALEEHVSQKLGIACGETSEDGQFSLEPVYCLGNCACGPSIRVDDAVHARVTPEKFDRLCDGIKEAQS
jgi:formate dehydrogenase subunit gamma